MSEHTDASNIREPAGDGVADRGVPAPSNAARVAVPAVLILGMIGIGVAVVTLGVNPQRRARAALEQKTVALAQELPRVAVATATVGPASMSVTLPARIEASLEASLYPQIGGYLSTVKVDIGDRVKEGDLLAQIETPVLDEEIRLNAAQVNAAEAKQAEAQARVDLAKLTRDRLLGVGDARAVSKQAIDEAESKLGIEIAGMNSAKADVESAKAAGQGLRERKALARIIAPFAGEISQRGYDRGALVVADKVDGATAIFRIVNRDTLRVFVDVPQTGATLLEVGQDVVIRVRELPGQTFVGKVVRASAAMDLATRTRLVEARVENSSGVLLPGMFAQSTLELSRKIRPVIVPAEALLLKGAGARVAVVDAKSTVHYRDIRIARDTGATLEVDEGLAEGERVVLNLTRDLAEGASVQVVEPAKK